MRFAFALIVLVSASCVSREGWGKGAYRAVVESEPLQVRRSRIRVDKGTGELIMNWIGARAPTGQQPLAEFTVTLFDDVNGDHVPQSSEVHSHRASSERSEKILFSDVRVPAEKASATWNLLVSARTLGGDSASNVFAFREDD